LHIRFFSRCIHCQSVRLPLPSPLSRILIFHSGRLAGILNALGVLNVSDPTFAKAVYELYEEYNDLPSSSTTAGKEARNVAWLALMLKWENFKTKHGAKRPLVEFLGCWYVVPFPLRFRIFYSSSSSLRDSVNSVGMIDNIKLAYTATNDIVRTFRHAVALDERRAKFKQNMWSTPKKPFAATVQPTGADIRPSVVTNVQEVWFAGCHCGTSTPHLSHTLQNLNIVLFLRRRWWIRAKRHAPKPRAHPAALDDP
jgi:hypothetical protein